MASHTVNRGSNEDQIGVKMRVSKKIIMKAVSQNGNIKNVKNLESKLGHIPH